MQFIYVKVPLLAGVADRVPALREAIERALSAQAVGELISWGTSLGAAPGRGPAPPSYHRLDIEVSDQARGLQVLKEALAGLACPEGTELHFTQARKSLQMLYCSGAWAGATPSTATSRPARHG